MDKLIWTAASGARAAMARQDAVSSNLANASTDGFRAERPAFRAVPVQGDGLATRVFGLETTAGWEAEAGPVRQTGRALDVALHGGAWLAVQGLDGNEGYTRAGRLDVGPDGVLMARDALPVVGEGGPIVVPAGAEVSIAADGTVTARSGAASTVVGRLKLVEPAAGEFKRGDDGLFRTASGEPATSSETARLASGALEGSNVDAVESMVEMMASSRQFEMQMKLLTSTGENEQRAARLLSPA